MARRHKQNTSKHASTKIHFICRHKYITRQNEKVEQIFSLLQFIIVFGFCACSSSQVFWLSVRFSFDIRRRTHFSSLRIEFMHFLKRKKKWQGLGYGSQALVLVMELTTCHSNSKLHLFSAGKCNFYRDWALMDLSKKHLEKFKSSANVKNH